MAQTTVLTEAGLAIWEAVQPGTIQATMLKVKLGIAQRQPSILDTDIFIPFRPQKEFAVSNVQIGTGRNATALYFAVTDISADIYANIGEIGLFADVGGEEVLFAYTSDPDAALPYLKVGRQAQTFRFQLNLNRTGTGESPIASSAMSLFEATDRVHGLVRLASDDERDLEQPPADRVLTALQSRQLLDGWDLLAHMLATIEGDPTDGQIIDYDDANTRLRFLSLMTAMLAAIEGDPTDGQIIDYDLANKRLRFRDTPRANPLAESSFNVTQSDVWFSLLSAGESLLGRGLLLVVVHPTGIADTGRRVVTIPGAAWDLLATSANVADVQPAVAAGDEYIRQDLAHGADTHILLSKGAANDDMRVAVGAAPQNYRIALYAYD